MSFLWGVATAAHQVEGGINGAGEPENNWADWERSGRVARAGTALHFWDAPEVLLDRASGLACNAFRLSLEWARLEPAPGRWDVAALERYAEIIRQCRTRGLEPVVTLHHFTHPLWAGPDFWLDPSAPKRFAAFCRRAVGDLGRALDGRPVRWWLTINEPLVVAVATYLAQRFPGRAFGPRATARAFDAMIAGHVLAYDAVHDVYEEHGWDAPLVSVNSYAVTAVDLDAVVVDALLAREQGVARNMVGERLRESRRRSRTRLRAVHRPGVLSKSVDALARYASRIAMLRPEGAAMSALYASPRERKLDYLAFDYYDPVVGNWARPATLAARELRQRAWFAELWEQVASPDGLAVFLRQLHLQAPDRPILVAENGMCTPDERARPDGVTRDAYVRAMTAELLRARDEGIAVAGYLHWTLADNYEWGSYSPRYGLYGVDRDGDDFTILDSDASGVDAAAVYRAVVESDYSGSGTARGRRAGRAPGASAL